MQDHAYFLLARPLFARIGLKPNGVIVAKENITSGDEVDVDANDSSVTRPLAALKKMFGQAGLDCDRLVKQNNFPKGLYAVYMFVLKPKIDVAIAAETLDTDNGVSDLLQTSDCDT